MLLWGSREVLEIASFPRMAACGVRNTLKFRQPHVLYNFRNLFWRRPGHIDSDLSASRSSRLLRGVTSAAAEDRENGNCPAKKQISGERFLDHDDGSPGFYFAANVVLCLASPLTCA